MEKNHRRHLKTRASKPFNLSSRTQEDAAKFVADQVWENLVTKYPDLEFNNLASLGLTGLDAEYCVNYLNRGYKKQGLPLRNLGDLQGVDAASGIKPDGGVFFVKGKDGFNHIVGALEVKHQGEYTGYMPLSDSDWKKKGGARNVPIDERPPQAQGNAIERFAKNANAIKTLTSFYGYNPYVVFCEGFDFFLKEDYKIFSKQPHADRYSGRDSAIIMRLIAGNDWMPVNDIYVLCQAHGDTKVCPATIMARMPKWKTKEIEDTLLKVMDISIAHLQKIGEV